MTLSIIIGLPFKLELIAQGQWPAKTDSNQTNWLTTVCSAGSLERAKTARLRLGGQSTKCVCVFFNIDEVRQKAKQHPIASRSAAHLRRCSSSLPHPTTHTPNICGQPPKKRHRRRQKPPSRCSSQGPEGSADPSRVAAGGRAPSRHRQSWDTRSRAAGRRGGRRVRRTSAKKGASLGRRGTTPRRSAGWRAAPRDIHGPGRRAAAQRSGERDDSAIERRSQSQHTTLGLVANNSRQANAYVDHRLTRLA